MPYEVYDIDQLDPSYKMKIERVVYRTTNTPEEIKPLVLLSKEELCHLRDESVAAEKSIFEKLREVVKEWEAQAGQTILYNQALQYLYTPAPEHTSNQWIEHENGWHRRSNTVYAMSYYIEMYTQYDRKAREEVPNYYITWSVFLNTQKRNAKRTIAGQQSKRFDDREKLDKYLAGRIKAYDKLFTEINPPIPPEYAKYFEVNGVLLPGYTIQTE